MDTSSKKKSTTDTGKKLIEKSHTSKRKVATASVTKKGNDLHSLEDTTTQSFEEEEKEIIASEAMRLGMEREARRKIEEQEKKRELHNKRMNLDLLSSRMNQGISRPWTYSYCQYVPAPQKDSGSEKSVTKTCTIKKK